MPIYSFQCANCGKRDQFFRKIDHRDAEAHCSKCGYPSTRQLDGPRVRADYPGYECPITGDWIEGRRAHRENLAKHGCRVYEPGETEAFKRRKAVEEAAFDASVESTVEQFVTELPSERREQLFAEVAAGADAAVVRN